MAFEKGNKAWRARTKHGRDKIFESPEMLWDACEEYFDWVEDNPLWEGKVSVFKGELTKYSVPKMRAMTINSLCLFLDIHINTWYLYRKQYDFIDIVTRAEETIRAQKFAGAAAELLNPNIIARELGLSDKRDNTHSGPDGGPIQTTQKVIRMKSVKADQAET